MLRSRVKSLRAKSKTLVRRESELKQYLAKLSETQKKTSTCVVYSCLSFISYVSNILPFSCINGILV